MIVYHGSDIVVDRLVVLYTQHTLDFGPGFYTTANKQQAIDFSVKVANRRHSAACFVSVYEFDEKAAYAALDTIVFPQPDETWLDFILANRQGKYPVNSCDLVTGPVANDDIYTTILLYEQGIFTKPQTLEALKIKKLYNQVVFKNDKALLFLRFDSILNNGKEAL